MSGLGDAVNKVKKLASDHPDQADRAADKAEDFAQERTGHGHDEQIEHGVDAVQRSYGGGGSGSGSGSGDADADDAQST
jgi:hypothetical protein